jgi:hypothetical protein
LYLANKQTSRKIEVVCTKKNEVASEEVVNEEVGSEEVVSEEVVSEEVVKWLSHN